jgi:hypothetical protein
MLHRTVRVAFGALKSHGAAHLGDPTSTGGRLSRTILVLASILGAAGAVAGLPATDPPLAITGTADTGLGLDRLASSGQAGWEATCAAQTLTQSSNPTLIGGTSVWCGDLDTSAQTSLARAFVAPENLIVRCVTFGVRLNSAGEWPVDVRVLLGPIGAPYESLDLLGEATVVVPAGTESTFHTVELPEISLAAGTSFIVELHTASRLLAEGGDDGLLSLGCNGAGQTAPTYIRGPACGIEGFEDLADHGFPTRHLVLSVGFDPATPTLDNPIEVSVPHVLDSGVHANPTGVERLVFEETVCFPGRPWVRGYFEEVTLPAGSYIRVSALDGATHTIDASQARMWSNATAYLNGDAIFLELIAGPHTEGTSFKLGTVGTQDTVRCDDGHCLLHPSPVRVQSNELWVGRHWPAGCTSNIVTALGGGVTAGHCWTDAGNDLIFNVPDSRDNCEPTLPWPDHQFRVIAAVHGGTGHGQYGHDWRVLKLGPNWNGETHFEKYGVFKPVSTVPVPVTTSLTAFGYGKGNPPFLNMVQRRSDGLVVTSSGTTVGPPARFYYNYSGGQVSPGNSGGAVVYDDYVVGIVTHCGTITRMDQPDFVAARAKLLALCAPKPAALGFWWPFDLYDDTNGTPEMINSNDALPYFATGLDSVFGKIGNAIDFYHATGGLYADVTSGGLSFGTGGGTICVWVKFEASGSSAVILDFESPPAADRYNLWAFPRGSDYEFRFAAGGLGSGNPAFFVTSTGTVPVGRWAHVAVTVSPSASVFPFNRDVKFYIDGVPAGSGVGARVPSIPAGPRAVIGAQGSFSKLPGLLDDLQVILRELSPAEVLTCASTGGTCSMRCSALWDVPFCDGDSAVTSYVTVHNDAPYEQEFHLSFTPLPAGPFPAGTIHGPTQISMALPNPFKLPAGGMVQIPIGIARPAGMTSTWQFATYEVTLTNLTGGTATTCLGSVQDRRDLCAVMIGGGGPEILTLSQQRPTGVGFELTNTSGASLTDAFLQVQAFGEDMQPIDVLSFNDLPAGEPLTATISIPDGQTAGFEFSVFPDAYVPQVISVVLFTDMDHDGQFEPLTSFACVVAADATCRADLDGDGMLTIFDFLAFQNAFDSGDPLADFDGDGALTIFDFLAFQNEFDAGCP